MIRLIFLGIWLAFKIWMLVDAERRGVAQYWYFIIFFVPLGAVVYFFIFIVGEINWKKYLERPPSTEKLRYRFETAPSDANQLDLAEALRRDREFSEALEHYRAVLTKHEEDVRALYGSAHCLVNLDRASDAVAPLQKLLEHSPTFDDWSGWALLAGCQWKRGEQDNCLATLHRLVERSPRIDHKLILAQFLLKIDRRDEARKLVVETLRDHAHAPAHIKRTFSKAAAQMKKLKRKIH